MEKDLKNRFDGRKPFDVIRAEDFGEDLHEFYEPLEKLIRRVSGVDIVGSRPVFLIGGRGTGKTMVLKFLSFEMQLKHFTRKLPVKKRSLQLSAQKIRRFLKEKKFLGIYIRFKTTEYDSMKGELTHFFKPYLSIKIAEQMFNSLKILKASSMISGDLEAKISDAFIRQVKEPKIETESSFDGALGLIKEKLLPLFETILEKKSFCSIAEIKENYPFPVLISKRIIFGLADFIFSELDVLRGKNLFILLDELEYLNEYQKRCIGELIKDSDETSVIFKVGSRYMPKELPVGESNEVLQEPHDFRVIYITDALNAAHSGKKTDYINLMKNILNRRLEKSSFFKKKGITSVEQLFPDLPIEKEACLLVRERKKHWSKFKNFLRQSKPEEEIAEILDHIKFPSNPIIEKLNMLLVYRGHSSKEIQRMLEEYLDGRNEIYANLFGKNALNLLFQLYNDYRSEKKYIGITVFIYLSSGIIRNAIEICNQALNTAYNFGYEPSRDKTVETAHQDIGSKTHARLQYDDMLRIPHNMGLEVRDLINQLGTIFRALHLNRYLVEPEPTHFTTVYAEIKGWAKEVFDAALKYSYLQKKPPMDPKSPDEPREDDYLINRVFAPLFKISYRVRGRTKITAPQIDSLITGDDREKKQTRRDIIRENSRKTRPKLHVLGVQKTLLDEIGERDEVN